MAGPHRNRTITVISLLTIAVSVLVMAGWLFHVPSLEQVVPGFVAMVFNAAFCFVLFAGALLAAWYSHGKRGNAVYFILSPIGTLIGVITLLEFLFNFNAGIDQLFVSDPQKISADHLYAGRMAYNAAVSFSLLGLGFLLINARNRAIKIFAQYLFHMVSILATIALIGYLYGVSLFNTLFYVSSMATHTAILFLLLSIGASLLNPSLGITSLFTGNRVGNQMAKRLFGLIVLMVLVFGSIRVQTQHYRIFSLDIGISLLAVCFLLMSLLIIWSTANWLNRIDVERTLAEAEVKLMNAELEKRVAERSAAIQKSEANLQSILKATNTIYALFDTDLKILVFNERAAKFFKNEFKHDVQKGDYISNLTSPGRLPIILGYAERVLDGEYVQYEINYPQPDGRVIWYDARLSPISNDKGEILGMLIDLHDVTESKINVQNLQSAYERIQDHINSIKEIAWKQSHLMRSPLANLKALTAILYEDPADNATLAHIRDELNRMDAIIIEMAQDASEHGE